MELPLTEQLKKANNEIKKAMHKLYKVQKSEQLHLELTSANPADLEVLEGLPLLCKIGVGGFAGPCNIHLSYRSEGDL